MTILSLTTATRKRIRILSFNTDSEVEDILYGKLGSYVA